MEKIRFILMYDFLFEVGGLEKLMALHANSLKNEGYEVLLLFGAIDKEMLKHKTFEGLRVEEYGSLKKTSFLEVLAAIFGANKLKKIIQPGDVIISYSFPVNYTIWRLKNIKIQYMNHFPNFLYLPFKEKIIWANNPIRILSLISSLIAASLIRKIDKKLVKNNELIFENSNFTKKRLDLIYGIKGIVSYPPISSDFKPWMDQKMLKKYSIRNRFILSSGRIIPDKRIDWLIDAFSMIEDKNIELLIAGQAKDKYKKKLLDYANKLGVERRIRFLDVIPKEDLVKLNSLAEVYAFPTPKEDFGLAPAEAISCGCPCIIWGDGSGPTEQIINGVNGVYAKPYSIADYARKIDLAIQKKWNRKKIVKTAVKFSQERQEKIFLNAIKRVVKN